MHNLLRFYNEFSNLAFASGKLIEAKTTASSLGLTSVSNGDVEITLKYVPNKNDTKESIKDGDVVVAFIYNKILRKANEYFYLGNISIPSGRVINKSSFTTKIMHFRKGSVVLADRTTLNSSLGENIDKLACMPHNVIVVRKLTYPEVMDYHFTYRSLLTVKMGKLADDLDNLF